MNLSQHKSIKTLKIYPDFVVQLSHKFLIFFFHPGTAPSLSLIIVYEESYFEAGFNEQLCQLCQRELNDINGSDTGGREHNLLLKKKLFRTLDWVCRERKFQLVLCAEVPTDLAEYAKKALEQDVETYIYEHGELGSQGLLGLQIISTKPRMGSSNRDQLLPSTGVLDNKKCYCKSQW